MKFSQEDPGNWPLIARTDGQTIEWNGLLLTQSAWLYQSHWQPWPVTEAQALFEPTAWHDLFIFCRQHPEVATVICGIGERHLPLPDACWGLFWEHGIGLECMNTLAACRTYNVLVSEKRPVVGAFLCTPPPQQPA